MGHALVDLLLFASYAHISYSTKFEVLSLFDSHVIHKYNNMSAVTTINILQFYGGVNDLNIVERKKIEKGMGGGGGLRGQQIVVFVLSSTIVLLYLVYSETFHSRLVLPNFGLRACDLREIFVLLHLAHRSLHSRKYRLNTLTLD